MRIGTRAALLALALAAAAPLILTANSTPDSARVETRLQLADLLYGDQRFWESTGAYDRAKEGARPDQLLRASSGLLRSLLHIAEFMRAEREAEFLRGLGGLAVPEHHALYAETLWALGLFPEAERMYEEVLAAIPGMALARHGHARGLAARGRLDEALIEVQAAIAAEDRPEFFHTLGTIYRRQRHYDRAADAFDQYVSRLSPSRQRDKVQWMQSEVRFLRSFGDLEPVAIAPDQRARVHTIPFRLEREKVIVQARLNGEGPIDLVVDTGTEQMVLAQETAQMVGVRPITTILSAGVGDMGLRSLEMGRADRLEVGTLTVENLPALIKNPPLEGLPETRSKNAFSPLSFGMSLAIDYDSRRMVVAEALPPQPAGINLPMRFQRLAMVRGVLNGEHEKSFIIDTGGEVVSISLSTAATLGVQPPRHIPLRVFGTSGWDETAYLLPGINLGFDRLSYDNLSVVVLNLHRPSALLGFHIGGIIGHRFLRNYQIALDLSDSVLRLAES